MCVDESGPTLFCTMLRQRLILPSRAEKPAKGSGGASCGTGGGKAGATSHPLRSLAFLRSHSRSSSMPHHCLLVAQSTFHATHVRPRHYAAPRVHCTPQEARDAQAKLDAATRAREEAETALAGMKRELEAAKAAATAASGASPQPRPPLPP